MPTQYRPRATAEQHVASTEMHLFMPLTACHTVEPPLSEGDVEIAIPQVRRPDDVGWNPNGLLATRRDWEEWRQRLDAAPRISAGALICSGKHWSPEPVWTLTL
mmetsp:Transcript_17973/g.37399  ORF Transcript_17973/g.37399 Transcript_17973/m.37399 type:complete len:104 (+) Transcript_17973:93-404(+)